jgi:hypothetical protein
MADEIIEELWAVKDSLAKEHRYDLDALCPFGKRVQGQISRPPSLSSRPDRLRDVTP